MLSTGMGTTHLLLGRITDAKMTQNAKPFASLSLYIYIHMFTACEYDLNNFKKNNDIYMKMRNATEISLNCAK